MTLEGFAQRAGVAATVVIAAALSGCGAPDEAKSTAPTADARAVVGATTIEAPPAHPTPMVSTGTSARSVAVVGAATTGAAAASTPSVRSSGPAPVQLVGTSISDKRAFAFIKEADQSIVTVREGDRVDGYTVAMIAPDRVRLTSSDNAEQLLVLAATASAASTVPASDGDPVSAASTGKIVGAINTDQSIPEHVTLGPTGSLPEGVRQMGH